MEASDHTGSRRSSDHSHRSSPSYFRNVVSLGPDSLSVIPTPSSSRNSSLKNSTKINNAGSEDTPRNDSRDGHIPVASPVTSYPCQAQGATPITTNIRSRKGGTGNRNKNRRRRRKRISEHSHSGMDATTKSPPRFCSCCCCCLLGSSGRLFWCCNDRKVVRSTVSCMNVVARVLVWCTVVAMVAGVVWYSYELKKMG